MAGLNRTPNPSRGPAHRIASGDLRPEQVPRLDADDDASLVAVARFAQSFNGYAHAGGPTRLGPIAQQVREGFDADGRLPAHVDDLRAVLFLWFRAERHGDGDGPSPDEAAWLNALLDAIREAVA